MFSRTFLVALACLAGIAGFAGGYYFYGPCGTSKVGRATVQLRQLTQEWEAASSLAASTSRIALAIPVTRLQDVRRQLDAATVPQCMEPANASLAEAMDETIAGYLAFMQNRSEIETTDRIVAARDAMARFKANLEVALDCAPFCRSDHFTTVPPTMTPSRNRRRSSSSRNEVPRTTRAARSGEFDLEISKVLAVNNISGCGQYEYEATDTSDADYLVRCTADGDEWKAYLVSVRHRTVQSLDTDLSPELHARRQEWERERSREPNARAEPQLGFLRSRTPPPALPEPPPDPNARELERLAEQQAARRQELQKERARVQPAMRAWVSAQLLPRVQPVSNTLAQIRSEVDRDFRRTAEPCQRLAAEAARLDDTFVDSCPDPVARQALAAFARSAREVATECLSDAAFRTMEALRRASVAEKRLFEVAVADPSR